MLQISFAKGVGLDKYIRYGTCSSLIRRNEELSYQRRYRHSNLCEFLHNGEKFTVQRKVKGHFRWRKEAPKQRHRAKQELVSWGQGTNFIC